MTKQKSPKQSASRAQAAGGASAASAFGPTSQHLQQAQDDLIAETSAFWTAWFQRRQDAMQELMGAASKITQLGGNDPAAALKLMTEWQATEIARLTKDASDTTAMMTRCIGSLMTHEAEVAEDLADATKAATSAHHATPV